MKPELALTILQRGDKVPQYQFEGILGHFMDGYIKCAFWSSTHPDDDEPLDENYGWEDLTSEAQLQFFEDCVTFMEAHAETIKDELEAKPVLEVPDIHYKFEQAGQEFWLTRNRHGAGFWDGDWSEAVGKLLTDYSHQCGECNLYPIDNDEEIAVY